jgi:4-diphosphocytidyl-2-C-methyl-D-erythritol kinase
VAAALVERAFAKVNLTLRVIRRRPDGYHDLDSVVAFARLADTVKLLPGAPLGLAVRGPTAAAAGAGEDNLVLKAARALAALVKPLTLGHFTLCKRLPVAAGLGGGSADAAAALRLIARANGIPRDDPRLIAAARATGADVPVCIDPRPRRMTGIGDVLSEPIDLPQFAAVLVNPGVALSTRDVFAAAVPAGIDPTDRDGAPGRFAGGRKAVLAALAASRNDLEASAISLQPAIAEVLAAMRALPGCDLARMSGSGATCFGLFATVAAADAAATALRRAHPGWWIEPTMLGHVREAAGKQPAPDRPG